MKRGEVWLINLDPTVGAEIQKTRPAVIVSSDGVGILKLKVIVPITEWKDRFAESLWMIRLNPDQQNGLSKQSAADAFQVRSIDQARCMRRIGALDDACMNAIGRALAAVLEI